MIDQLIPVIQPANWGGVPHTVCRPFFEGENSPLYVSYAVVTPETNMSLVPDALQESGKTIEEVEAESILRWVEGNSALNWEEMEIPGHEQKAMAVTGESDVISSMLLSHGHLKGIQKHFGTEVVQVIIPNRFTILAHPCPISIPPLAMSLYQEAQATGTELSPVTFQLMDGHIVAYAELASETPAAVQGSSNEALDAAVKVLVGAFLIVSAADGTIDEEELAAFGGNLVVSAQGGTSLAHQACAYILEQEFQPIIEAANGGVNAADVMIMLIEGKSSFENLAGSQETDHLREMARMIAQQVAEASGGGFLGLGSKVSKQEKIALEALQSFLE